jgi:hypothetical protein
MHMHLGIKLTTNLSWRAHIVNIIFSRKLIKSLSGCLTKNHAERFRLKIRFPLYFYHELPLS